MSASRFRLAVVHWFPLELFPPVTNLLTAFGDEPIIDVRAFSTRPQTGRALYRHDAVRVDRTEFPQAGYKRIRRIVGFAFFPVFVLYWLLRFRPHAILYFESHSSFPVLLYSWLNRRCRIFIHYHEYHEQHEYQRPGMRLVGWYHRLERRFLYRRSEWISQTNPDRVRLFLEQYREVPPVKLNTLANLPPQNWQVVEPASWPKKNEALKFVYVGAVSLQDTFIEPLIEWIQQQPCCTLDIYTHSIDKYTHDFLQVRCTGTVRYLAEGLPYMELSKRLREYHVGLILYRGNTLNYVYNAPNKLFEYLVCGLDVWYPKQMEGIHSFRRQHCVPRVVEIDFENLNQLPLAALRIREGIPDDRFSRSCEDELQPLRKALLSR